MRFGDRVPDEVSGRAIEDFRTWQRYQAEVDARAEVEAMVRRAEEARNRYYRKIAREAKQDPAKMARRAKRDKWLAGIAAYYERRGFELWEAKELARREYYRRVARTARQKRGNIKEIRLFLGVSSEMVRYLAAKGEGIASWEARWGEWRDKNLAGKDDLARLRRAKGCAFWSIVEDGSDGQ